MPTTIENRFRPKAKLFLYHRITDMLDYVGNEAILRNC